MPVVRRGAGRDYEEAEDDNEEDPMIFEEIELLCRMLLESAFLFGQYLLFRFKTIFLLIIPAPHYSKKPPSAPPTYHSLKKEPLKAPLPDGKLDYRENMANSAAERFALAGAPREHELERLREHLRLAQEHLEMAFHLQPPPRAPSPSRSSSPEANGMAAEQNRLNLAHEKGGGCERSTGL
ncbi:hypothetical protein ASZ78_011361 [Callipepla squamata]|uniref:Uncharacterized protein n=1 Tax=Callipepla squamata TaxID=9009 RepID=A0A226NP19_CALSU|nr:hypothetical protein ASZ78_011361 [Callipepla squamata]